MQTIATPVLKQLNGIRNGNKKKILFATMPTDGHFSPLTSLAKHLANNGYDVRWYAGNSYGKKLQQLQIPHYPFEKAKEVTAQNIDQVFPERKKIRGQIKKLRFDMIHYFILRAPEYYTDIKAIYEQFPFDVLIADNCFAGSVFVKDKMQIPVVLIGIVPLCESSRDLGPSGLGLVPPAGILDRVKCALLKKVANTMIFGKPNKVMWEMLSQHGIDHSGYSLFDLLIKKADMLLQSGTPGFEFKRSDISPNIRFIGPVLPCATASKKSFSFGEKMKQYEKVILITQGTFEPDSSKLIIPALEALKDSNYLVIVTTAGNGTADLRNQYPQANILIEDFIPFNQVMPLADVFISNGGYGGVLLSIANKLPMVVAGVHEGKNEINARVGYFKLGINLKTETPSISAIYNAVEKVLHNEIYLQNTTRLSQEFSWYNSAALCEKYVDELTQQIPTPALLHDQIINN